MSIISCQHSDELILADGGESQYKIVVPASADSLTLFAASEFRDIVYKATRAEIEIIADSSKATENEICIGNSNRSLDFVDELAGLHEDGFIIESKHQKLFIVGGEDKGVLYGVYTFMEDFLNCRKYIADKPIIPKWETLKIPSIHIRQEPAFNYRELHMPLAINDAEYRNWHKLDVKEGKNEWGLFVHTFDDFVPPGKYFKTHPEYFSYLNVKRIPDGQLCLFNAEVFDLVVDGLKTRMKEHPGARFWSVSQNDTFKPCECDACRKEYEEYGGYSGALIHFVNKVAAQFPDKIISTLAYEYTRSAPTYIKPASNVNIMFCSIECNRSRPLISDPGSASFRKDMEDWCKLTEHIFMWDYVVQFRNLVSPFPNLRVLQPNIRFFGIMEFK